MRFLSYLLSVLIIIAPAYNAYAAVNLSKGQIVDLGKKGGALVKTGGGALVKVGKVGTALSPAGALLWCVKYSKKCKDHVGDTIELVCDVTGVCTANHRCVGRIYYVAYSERIASRGDAISSSIDLNLKRLQRSYPNHQITVMSHTTGHLDELESRAQDVIDDKIDEYETGVHDVYSYRSNDIFEYRLTKDGVSRDLKSNYSVAVIGVVDCGESKGNRQLSKDDLDALAKKIADSMDDDDIKNYYNTDYDDVTINNYHYYGDQIDNDTNIDNQCQNNSCNEISKDIEKDIMSKKYDIDDVTPANCTMEENTGKYISCNMDLDNEDNSQDNDTTNNTTTPKDDDEPPVCKTSDFFKEACEYFDWVDDEPSKKQDTKVNVNDDEEETLNKDRIDIDEGCPTDDVISVSMPWGYATTINFTYKPYCDFARSLKPYMTATGAIVSMYIVGSCGRRL